MTVQRFDVFLVSLDPAVGREIRKTRPCLVISPDEMNKYLSTVLVAPMTTRGRPYPTRVACTFHDKKGSVALDQIRSVDRARLVRRLGKMRESVQEEVLAVLAEMFAR